MKTILKRNQVILSVIALMLITAGYMSYTADGAGSSNIETSKLTEEEMLAELGDAQLVSTNVATQEDIATSSSNVENQDDTSYFTESKLEREKMYSQMLESYQKLLESSQISSSQKEISQTEISKINEVKNAIMISENLIKNKGFSDVVIFVNGNSVNIVVKAKELSKEQIAQIQNIVMRELQDNIENIHISCKE